MNATVTSSQNTSPDGREAVPPDVAALAAALDDRASVRAASRGLVSLFVALVGLGVSIKLFHDSRGVAWWAVAMASLDLGAWIVAAASLVRATRLFREEAEILTRLGEAGVEDRAQAIRTKVASAERPQAPGVSVRRGA